MSSDYYPALQPDNCKLITWPIATISPQGSAPATASSTNSTASSSPPATTYTSMVRPTRHRPRGRVLKDEWAARPQGDKSGSAQGYPNLFFPTGPNSVPGHNSLLVFVQGQIEYAVRRSRRSSSGT